MGRWREGNGGINRSKDGDGPLRRERGKLVLGTVIAFYGGLRQSGAAAAALTIAISDSEDGDGPLRRERGKLVLGNVTGSYSGLRQRGAAAAALTMAISYSKDGDGPLRRERGNVCIGDCRWLLWRPPSTWRRRRRFNHRHLRF